MQRQLLNIHSKDLLLASLLELVFEFFELLLVLEFVSIRLLGLLKSIVAVCTCAVQQSQREVRSEKSQA